MSVEEEVQLVVVGSVGIDTIETPYERREDFPEAYEALYRKFNINLSGLQKEKGETFRWSGVYQKNMDERNTLSTELNVFADFSPRLPGAFKKAPFLFLANIGPQLQGHVLDQAERPAFVAMDTMDLWINTQREALIKVIGRVDLLTLNESEARHLSGKHFLPAAAARLLELGPRYVLIKKGEHGSVLFSRDRIFIVPAYPLETVCDPTGAGDAFAGGFMGALAAVGAAEEDHIRAAMVYGSVVASFAVEAFSLDRLASLSREEIEARTARFKDMIRVPDALIDAV